MNRNYVQNISQGIWLTLHPSKKSIIVCMLLLSFLSIPNPSGLGITILSYTYILLVLFLFYVVLLRIKFKVNDKVVLNYFLLFHFFLSANLVVANINGVSLEIWTKRTIAYSFYFVFYILIVSIIRKNFSNIYLVEKTIYWIGIFEVFLILISIICNKRLGVDGARASKIGSMLTYSVCCLFSINYASRKFIVEKKRIYLTALIAIIIAVISTASRIFFVSSIMIIFYYCCVEYKVRKTIIVTTVLVILLLFNLPKIGSLTLMERVDLADATNIVTIISKVEEVKVLWKMFLDNPILGIGYGFPYKVNEAVSVYSYSHNLILFNLGYGGVLGLALSVMPILFLFKKKIKEYYFFSIAMLVFYCSSTTYTNFKHSILMAFFMALSFYKSGLQKK